MRSFSLRDWQKSSVARLLRLKDVVDAVGEDEGGNWSEEWKVLLLDSHTRSIVSPLLTVPQLRSLGVTLTLSLESPRDAIPDVSAVYFVRPTPASLRTILDDCASARYRDSYLHFSSPLPRPHLEALARGCVEAGVAARIRKVTDAWQAFIALEPHLFSLAHRPSSSYAAYASPAAANEEAQGAFLEECTQGLLGTLATAGIVPLIVYQPGGPSAALARALEGAIREHLAAPGQGVYGPVLGSGGASSSPPPPAIVGAFGRRATPMGVGQGSRPVLILLDRGCDLATPMAHASTYRALMDDTLGPIGLNRVTVPADLDDGGGGGGGGSAAAAAAASASSTAAGWLGGVLGGSSASKAKAPGKVVALDVEMDPFWITHAGDEFPVASEAAAAEVARLAEREGVIRSAAGGGGGEGGDAAALQHQQAMAAAGLPPEGGESELGSAIDSLPALLRHKAILKTHSTLLTAIMASVRKRALPSFSEVQPPSRSPMEKPAVLAILAEAGKGSVDDKARLACVHLLTCSLSAGDEGGGGSPAFTSTASALDAEYSECLAALRQGVMGEYGSAPPPVAAGGQQQQQQQQPTLPAHIAAELGRATAALAYCKFIRVTPGAGGLGCHSYTAGGGLPNSSTASSAVGNLLGGMARAAMRGINAATRLMTTENTRPPIVRVTAAVCEGNPKLAGPLLTPLVEALEVRDPRMGGNASTQKWVNYLAAATATANAAAGGTAPPSGLAVAGAHFRNACVFITGGGSYVEYGELERYAQEGKEGAGGGGGGTNPLGARTIVYGSTEMTSPSGFLAQLAELGAPHVRL